MVENAAEPVTPRAKRGASRRPATFEQERIVRRYLSEVEGARAGRNLKRTADAVGNRITKVDELLVSADPLSRVHLTQERIELHAEYVRLTNGSRAERSQLERDFIRVVRSYGDRHGITYAAWRQVGVDAGVLERAGIHKAEKKPPPAALRAAEEAEQAARSEGSTAAEQPAKATGPKPGPGPKPGAGAGAVKGSPEANGSLGSDAQSPPAESSPARTRRRVSAEPPDEKRTASRRSPSTAAATEPSVPPPAAAPKGAGEATEAVSLDELASLLADASDSSQEGAPASQPRLGDDIDGPPAGGSTSTG